MEEETSINNIGNIAGNALLQQRYSTGVVTVSCLDNEAKMNQRKPIRWLLYQHLHIHSTNETKCKPKYLSSCC